MDCICTALRRAAQDASASYDAALAPSGLKVTMFRLLCVIRDHREASLTEVADRLGLDRSTLGRNLTVLERRGLAERVRLADGRAAGVALTDAGKSALDEATPLWKRAQADIRKQLGTEDTALLAALQRLSG